MVSQEPHPLKKGDTLKFWLYHIIEPFNPIKGLNHCIVHYFVYGVINHWGSITGYRRLFTYLLNVSAVSKNR